MEDSIKPLPPDSHLNLCEPTTGPLLASHQLESVRIESFTGSHAASFHYSQIFLVFLSVALFAFEYQESVFGSTLNVMKLGKHSVKSFKKEREEERKKPN